MSRNELCPVYSVPGGLLEGPRYDAVTGCLVFSDARLGGVYSLSDSGRLSTLVEHRRGIGGLVLHENGGLVVTGRNVAYKAVPAADGDTPVLLDRDAERGRVGFNDLTTDQRGRVYVGAVAVVALHADLADPSIPPGTFWLIEEDGSARPVGGDVRVANGVALSADGRTLYAADSGRRVVFAYDVDPESGELSGRRVLLADVAGVPDGMATDLDDTLWLAHAYAGKIVRYDAQGRELSTIDVPVPMVTSLTFGGRDDSVMYVVTGSDGDGSDGNAYAYALRTGTPGTPVARAAIALPPRDQD